MNNLKKLYKNNKGTKFVSKCCKSSVRHDRYRETTTCDNCGRECEIIEVKNGK
jgi:hypothetical protein